MIFLSLLLLSSIEFIKAEENLSYYEEKIEKMQKIIDPIYRKCSDLGETSEKMPEIHACDLGENSEEMPAEFDPKKALCQTMENLNKLFVNAKREIKDLLKTFNNIYKYVGGLENAKSKIEKLQKTFNEIRIEILKNDLGGLLSHYQKLLNEGDHWLAIYNLVKEGTWNKEKENDENNREYTRRRNLNLHFLELFTKLKKLMPSHPQMNEIILKMLFTGQRMGLIAFKRSSEEKLEWALQQLAVNLFVYRMEIPEMFPEGDIKFPIGMKP